MASLPDPDPDEVRTAALLFCIERVLHAASLSHHAGALAARPAPRPPAPVDASSADLRVAVVCARLHEQLDAMARAMDEAVRAMIITGLSADAVEQIDGAADVSDALYGSGGPAEASSPARAWLDAAANTLALARQRDRAAGDTARLPIQQIEDAFALAVAAGRPPHVGAALAFVRAALLAGWGPRRPALDDAVCEVPMFHGAYVAFLERARVLHDRGELDAPRASAAALAALGHKVGVWTTVRRQRQSRAFKQRRRAADDSRG